MASSSEDFNVEIQVKFSELPEALHDLADEDEIDEDGNVYLDLSGTVEFDYWSEDVGDCYSRPCSEITEIVITNLDGNQGEIVLKSFYSLVEEAVS